MELCEENFEDSREKRLRHKKILEERQKTRSPFLIGTIEDLNRRISKLDRKLQNYTQLVVESRASDHPDMFEAIYGTPGGSTLREQRELLEKGNKDVNRFAGMFSIKSTFTPGASERVKNISKISLQNSSTAMVKKDLTKPRFVELHQYPGYDNYELTSLPGELPALHVLQRVRDATMNLQRKERYRDDFERMFFSPMSQAIFQDIFWYIFLEKFQTNKGSQHKLFNRVAHNYVKLLSHVRESLYRESFLKDYPNLMSQSVYTAYSNIFPDSYTQFDENFKNYLVSLVTEWMTGIRPAPRAWQNWNFKKLDPPNLKGREEILNQANKKTSATTFELLEGLGGGNSTTPYSSSTSINHSSSNSSALHRASRRQLTSKQCVSNTSDLSDVDSENIKKVHSVQLSGESLSEISQNNNKQKPLELRQKADALTPIREITEVSGLHMNGGMKNKKGTSTLASRTQSMTRTQSEKMRIPKESYPACGGPYFVHSVFDVYGQSPLVAHFLCVKKLASRSGVIVKVQRTEIESLPPLDAPTYRDVIKESFRHIYTIKKEYNDLIDHDQRDIKSINRRQRQLLKESIQNEAMLLSKPREVKRLCDLLMLERKKGHDFGSGGADMAIEAALASQEWKSKADLSSLEEKA